MLGRKKTKAPGKISIDPGAFRVRLHTDSQGLILDEPAAGLLNMDATEAGPRAAVRFGQSAIDAFNKNPDGVQLMRPLQSDCNNNIGYSPRMLNHFMRRAKSAGLLAKSPIVLLALPENLTELQRDQLRHTCFTAGAARVHSVDGAIASALGAGIDTESEVPSVLIDLGARSSRLFAYCENEVVAASTLHCGGDRLDDAIVAGVMKKFNIRISDYEAQNCKHRVGCAVVASYGQRLRNSCQSTGYSLDNNEEIRFQISTEDMQEMIDPDLSQLSTTIHTAINTLPLWIQDVVEQKGITLTGGGALLPQIDQLAMEASDVPIEVAHRPLSSTVRGGTTMLNRIHGGSKREVQSA